MKPRTLLDPYPDDNRYVRDMKQWQERWDQHEAEAAETDKHLRAALAEQLVSVLPYQHIDRTLDTVMSSRLAERHREMDREWLWAQRDGVELCAARRLIVKLEQLLDLTRLEQVRAVLALVRGIRWPRGSKAQHGDDCHAKHAHCLAERVEALLTISRFEHEATP